MSERRKRIELNRFIVANQVTELRAIFALYRQAGLRHAADRSEA